MPCSIGPAEEIILLFSRSSPSPEAARTVERLVKDRGNPVDYVSLERLASANGVSQLVYHNLRGANLDAVISTEDAMERMRRTFLLTVRDNAAKARETMRLTVLLRSRGIESIPLKGATASDLILGNSGLYPSTDIDMMIRPSDLEKTKAALADAGYRSEGGIDERDVSRNTYHVTLYSDQYVVEVHWTLAFRYFDIPTEFWWQETGIAEYEGEKISVLSSERYLLYAIFRLYNKAFMPLKFFVLPAEIIGKYGEEIDWHKLVAFAEQYRMKRLVIFTLRLLNDLLGAAVPDQVTGGRIFGYGSLKRLVLSGLFGRVSRVHFRMMVFTLLQDRISDTLGILLRRVFPDKGEIRLRYHLSPLSRKTCLYYLLNPFLLLLRKERRRGYPDVQQRRG